MAYYGNQPEWNSHLGSATRALSDQLVSSVQKEAVAVSDNKETLTEAIVAVGACAVRCNATGSVVNAAMAQAAELLDATGRGDAAANLSRIGRGVIAFLLISSVVPGLKHDTAPAAKRVAPGGFIPTTPF